MLRSGHQLVERLALVFHDWWATSNDAVGSNELMLAQTNVFRAHGLGSFRDMTRAVTTDPAMLVFLNGIDNRRRAVNENYARGRTDGAVHARRRPRCLHRDRRARARAIADRLARRLELGRLGLHDFRFYDPDPLGLRDEDRVRQLGHLHVGGRLPARGRPSACTRGYSVAKLWSYFVPVPPAPDVVRRSLERLYVQVGQPDPPGARGDPLLAGVPHEGPRPWSSLPSCSSRACCALWSSRSPASSGSGSPTAPASGSTGRPTSPAWDDKRWLDSNTIRARWDVVNYAVEGHTLRPDGTAARTYPDESAEAAVAGARAFWLDPSLTPATVDWLTAFARDFQPPADTTSTPSWQKIDRATKRPAPGRPASSHRRLRRLPDQLMPSNPSSSCGCAGFSHCELLRSGAATAGRGLRPIEPGMPLPAGTGLSRRSFVSRSAGLALAVFGGGALSPRALQAGIESAQAAGPGQVLVSIFCAGGLDSLSLLAPVGDSRYAGLRGGLALPPDSAFTFSEDDRLRWHPDAAAFRDLHTAGRLTVIPAIGYDDPNQSHFTSRHYWEVGTGTSRGLKARKEAPAQLCRYPDVRTKRPRSSEWCALNTRGVAKAKIKKYRERRRAKKLKAAA